MTSKITEKALQEYCSRLSKNINKYLSTAINIQKLNVSCEIYDDEVILCIGRRTLRAKLDINCDCDLSSGGDLLSAIILWHFSEEIMAFYREDLVLSYSDKLNELLKSFDNDAKEAQVRLPELFEAIDDKYKDNLKELLIKIKENKDEVN